MLYNIISNKELKSTYATPTTTGGLNDLAFENGWRITHHAIRGIETVRYLKDRDYNVIASVPHLVVNQQCYTYLTEDEWNDLVNTMYSDEDTLMADSSNYSPYIEDVADEPDDEYGEWAMLEEPETEDADELVEL